MLWDSKSGTHFYLYISTISKEDLKPFTGLKNKGKKIGTEWS